MGQIIDINDGRLLVATDIHGNWDDYQAIRAKFVEVKRQGNVDILVFDGDLIHGYEGYEDRSKDILDDLIDNPDPTVLTLLGNHEFMHIYHLDVSKNGKSFTDVFEEEIKSDRERYVGFMRKMPYAIRTAGGVVINHTGANPPMAGIATERKYEHLAGPQAFHIMNKLEHDEILGNVHRVMSTILEDLYPRSLSVEFFEEFNSEIGDVFDSTDIGAFLWDVFFNKNEQHYDEVTYSIMLTRFLKTMSLGDKPQQFVVSGHIEVPLGYEVIAGKQLRICSSYGADEGKKVLSLVDASRQYESVVQLIDDLQQL